MTGRYRVRVRNSRNDYSFELKRNITVLCGDSGKGKTTLYDMVEEYNRFGKSSGVSVSCDRPLIALDGNRWQSKLEEITGNIVVIDEDSHFVRSDDFARAVRNSDNYYLLITRNYLPGLPYSVEEIYELSGRKNKRFVPVYQETDRMYDKPLKQRLPFVPDVIITEDSRAGFQFFRRVADIMGILCVSSNGKSNIHEAVKQYRGHNVAVIADGAAFGPEIRSLVEQQRLTPNKIAIFLPESFEWLILVSDRVKISDPQWIESPENYADSRKYMSWEQYFAELLIRETRDHEYKRYRKEQLPGYYLQEESLQSICREIKGIDLRVPRQEGSWK